MKFIYSAFIVILLVATFTVANIIRAAPKGVLGPQNQRELITRSIAQQCCTLGKETTQDGCDSYKPSPVYDPQWNNFCRQEYMKCCNAEKVNASCQLGKRAAYEGAECSTLPVSNPTNVFQWHCCDACRVGISKGQSVASAQECHQKIWTDRLEDRSLVECCLRTVEQNKQKNEKLFEELPENVPTVDPCADCQFACESDGSAGMRCTCPEGYNLHANKMDCVDVDECASLPPPCSNTTRCVNTPGSYSCQNTDTLENPHQNNSGDLVSSGSGSIERRVLQNSTNLDNQEEPSPDSFEMTPESASEDESSDVELPCDDGYRRDEDSKECEDIDECVEKTHNCKEEAKCINVDGSFNCKSLECASGYRYDEELEECADIDECEETTGLNVTKICEDHQKCLNLPGSFKCEMNCPEGQRLHSGYLSSTCVDIDECVENTHSCVDPHVCHNVPGSFECKCKEGFKEDASGQCTDIDECKSGDNQCHTSGRSCHNTLGSYKCLCGPGFEELHGTCIDTDECDEEPSPCPENSRCKNLPGNHECTCLAGYSLGHNGTCVNSSPCQAIEENGTCFCPNGFQILHDQSCGDINECSNSPCGEDDICLNLFGSYKCVPAKCPSGYEVANNKGADHPKCVVSGYVGCLKGNMSDCRNLVESEVKSMSIDYHAVALEPHNMTVGPIYVTRDLSPSIGLRFSVEPKSLAKNFELSSHGRQIHLVKSLEKLTNANMTVFLDSKRSEKVIHRSFVMIYVSEINEGELIESMKTKHNHSH